MSCDERAQRGYLYKSVSQSLHASKPGMIGPEGKSLGVAVPCRLVPNSNYFVFSTFLLFQIL